MAAGSGTGPKPSGPQRAPSGKKKPTGPPKPPRPPREDSGEPRTGARLQKVLAHAGLGSRRACEELILQGRVTVDGEEVRELGTRVDPKTQKIALDGQPIRSERMVYFAVCKPKGYVSTNSDPAGRPRVVDLLPEIPERVFAVGRLDEASVGLMILTNDGELANRLAHPKFGVEKVYKAVVAGEPSQEVLDKLIEGVWLAEGKARARRARVVGRQGASAVLELVLAEGKNREVRRMLAKLGHKVMSLVRVAVGPVSLRGLKPGGWRHLTSEEVDLLRRVAEGQPVPTARGPRVRDTGPPRRGPDRPDRAAQREAQPGPYAGGPRGDGPRPPRPTGPRAGGDGPPRPTGPRPTGPRAGGDGPPRPYGPRPAGPRADAGDGPPRPGGPRIEGPRPTGPRAGGDGPPRPYGPRPSGPRADAGDGPPRPYGPRPSGPRRADGQGPRGPRPSGPRPYGPRPGGPRPDGPRLDGPRPMGPRRADSPGPRGPRPGGPPRMDGPPDQGPRPGGPRIEGPRPTGPRGGPDIGPPPAGPRPSGPRPGGPPPPRGDSRPPRPSGPPPSRRSITDGPPPGRRIIGMSGGLSIPGGGTPPPPRRRRPPGPPGADGGPPPRPRARPIIKPRRTPKPGPDAGGEAPASPSE